MTQNSDRESASPTDRAPRRWLLVAFFCSLALNLLVIGIVAGARISGSGQHDAMISNTAFSVGRAIWQFPELRREQLWPVAKPHFQNLRKTLRELRQAHSRFERAYKAEPIDLAELDASHAVLSEQVKALQQMNFQAIRALAAALSPAERVQLLEALRPPGGHHPRRPHADRANQSARDNTHNEPERLERPERPERQ